MKLNNNKLEWAGYGLFALRVITGIAFLYHGLGKLFGEGGISGVAGFFGQAGIPLASFAAYLVTAVEVLGGLALILGVFTCGASILLGLTMLVAIFAVHFKNGFNFMAGGYEYNLVLMAVCFALYTNGPGKFSAASCCGKKCTDGTCESTPTAPQA